MTGDRIEQAWAEYVQAVSLIALDALREKVWPLFERRQYRMLSGNGTYYVEDRNGKQLETDPQQVKDDHAYRTALEVLARSIPGMPAVSLGALGFDYPE